MASVSDRQPDREPEDASKADPLEPVDAPESPPESSPDRRAFMRQMSRDAVQTAGRLAGLSTVVRRSVFAAGEAVTRDLEPAAEEELPRDPQPVPACRSRTPPEAAAGRPGRRRPAPGTDRRAGPDPDHVPRAARLPGDRRHGDAGRQRPRRCAPADLLDVPLGWLDAPASGEDVHRPGRPTSIATPG